jgi:CRISPR-associated protein Cas1
MTTRWRIVDLASFSGTITTKRGRLTINNTEIPLADVTCIITGPATTWDAGLPALATSYDIPIIICDWRNIPIATLTGWGDNTRIGARQTAQANLSLPRKKNAWMHIVRAKILGQAANLPSNTPQHQRLQQLARSTRSGDPNNTEATAARTYWQHVFPGETFRRDTNSNGRNSLLNYGYTILRGAIIRGIITTGLTPTLGIHHKNRANPFALADDLIEPFRPAIDHLVQQLPADTELKQPGTRQHLAAGLTLPTPTGETLNTAITNLCQRYANYVEGNTKTLEVPTWSPQGG